MKGGMLGFTPSIKLKKVSDNEVNTRYIELIKNQKLINKLLFDDRFYHFLQILKYKIESSNDSTYPGLREKYLEIRRKYIDKFREIESLNRNGDDLNTLNLAIIDLIMRKEKTIKNTKRNIKNIQDLRQFFLLCINDYIDFIVSFYSIVLQNSRNELNLIRKILLNLFNEENFMKLIDSILRKKIELSLQK